MSDNLRGGGKVPIRTKILTIERIVGDIWFAIFLRTVVGWGHYHKMS